MYKPATATPFQAPAPFTSPGAQSTPYTAPVPPAYEAIQHSTQSGNTEYAVAAIYMNHSCNSPVNIITNLFIFLLFLFPIRPIQPSYESSLAIPNCSDATAAAAAAATGAGVHT